MKYLYIRTLAQKRKHGPRQAGDEIGGPVSDNHYEGGWYKCRSGGQSFSKWLVYRRPLAAKKVKSEVCPECERYYPGHAVGCKTGNERARIGQQKLERDYRASLAAKKKGKK